MATPSLPRSSPTLLLRNALLAMLLWTAGVSGSWWWSYNTHQQRLVQLAKVEAATNINKDWSFRLWATSHGGVYVPPDEKTPPNPYLAHIPDRDIVTTKGKRLTLMNPAYMLRQVMQGYSDLYGVKGHITSLKLTNPINVADAWEEAALKSFQQGTKEAMTVTQIDGKPYLRLMRPITMEKGCLKCHADTGVKLGEIRGGISTAIPMEPLYIASEPELRNTSLIHGIVWLLGVSAIGFVSFRTKRETETLDVERKMTEDALRRSASSLAEAQRIAHLGNWDLDLINNILTWSDEIYRIFEIDPREFGASYDAFLSTIHPDDRDMVNAAYTESVKNRVPYDIVHRLLMKDGRIKYVNEKCETYYDGDGKPLRSVGTVHDITERKLAEEEIRSLNRDLEQRVVARTAQLEAANKDLESFSYSVSHDLRAPLRAIDGFSLILLEDYADKLDDEGKRVINVVRDNTQKMGQLIDDILSFSRAGRKELETTAFDMAELAGSVFEELKPATAGRVVQLDIKPLAPAIGDRAMVHQVLFNLLSNAVKFTRHKETAQIEIGSRVEGRENVYWVKDNGAGFDMQYSNKLFGVFQRLHRMEEFEGTGVGLAIVKRIVDKHGGRVWAEGKIGEGATFYFTLPRLEGETHEPQ